MRWESREFLQVYFWKSRFPTVNANFHSTILYSNTHTHTSVLPPPCALCCLHRIYKPQINYLESHFSSLHFKSFDMVFVHWFRCSILNTKYFIQLYLLYLKFAMRRSNSGANRPHKYVHVHHLWFFSFSVLFGSFAVALIQFKNILIFATTKITAQPFTI